MTTGTVQRACQVHGFGVICGVGCGEPPYADTDVVLLALGGTVAAGDALGDVVGGAASAVGAGGPPYASICAWPHATVASANIAARDVRTSGDAVVSIARAPQNGHASPERT